MPRMIGVDPGEQRTGLAVCDDAGLLAVPIGIIERRGRSLDRVAAEIAVRASAYAAEAVVVGLPLNMDGSEGEQARRARGLGGRIASPTGLPLAYRDERLSSFTAEQRLADAPGRRRRRHNDDLAAAIILQAYLDASRAEAGG